jgi:hypothetical protein
MRRPSSLFPIAAALGAIILVPGRGVLAQPTPITACQLITASGSYVLTKDLTTAGDCLVLAHDFITIDLAGFSITGNGTGGGIVAAHGLNEIGLAVRNGSVFRFDTGVDFQNASGPIVEGLRIYLNKSDGVRAFGITMR